MDPADLEKTALITLRRCLHRDRMLPDYESPADLSLLTLSLDLQVSHVLLPTVVEY